MAKESRLLIQHGEQILDARTSYSAPKKPIFFDKIGAGDPIIQPFMNDTNGGGMLEDVPGFGKARASVTGLPFANAVSGMRAVGRGHYEDFFSEGDPLVRVPDTTALPWRSIVYLDLLLEDGRAGFGTGWFVQANTIVTAAHCLFDAEHAVGVQSITAYAGFAPNYTPFTPQKVSSIYVPQEWKVSVTGGKPDPVFDYALAYLPNNNFGASVSWFGLAAPPDDALNDLQLNIAGYLGTPLQASLYFDGGRLVSFDDNFLYHRFDTQVGMSGSPIIVRRNDRRIAIGIHTWGSSQGNRARRIDTALFAILKDRLR